MDPDLVSASYGGDLTVERLLHSNRFNWRGRRNKQLVVARPLIRTSDVNVVKGNWGCASIGDARQRPGEESCRWQGWCQSVGSSLGQVGASSANREVSAS